MKTSLRLAALACAASLALGLVGCATVTPEAMKAEIAGYKLPASPSAGKALVYVLRPGPEMGLLGLTPAFVYVDDAGINEHLGYTRSGQYLLTELAPGPHKIRSGSGGFVDFQAKGGETRFLKQHVGIGGLGSLEEIDDLNGKYLMKSRELKLGSPSEKSK